MVGDLDVEIIVPRHGLAIPPPAEEGAVSEPGLDAVVMQDSEVRADKVAEDLAVLRVGYLVLEVADVVVATGERAAGFVEVLGGLLRLGLLLAVVANGGVVVRGGKSERREGEEAQGEGGSQTSHCGR